MAYISLLLGHGLMYFYQLWPKALLAITQEMDSHADPKVSAATGRVMMGSSRLRLIVLPLILLLTLGLDLIYADHLPQLYEPKASEGLGEDVSELPTGLDKLDDNLSSIDTIPKKVEFDVDVLAPIVEDRVLGERDGRIVVHHQRR
jgi:hypothetical protein